MTLSIQALYDRLHLALAVPDDAEIHGVSTLEQAGSRDLCFAEDASQADAVASSAAALVLVGETFPEVVGKRLLRVAEPRNLFFEIALWFVPVAESQGIHPAASVHPTADLGEDVEVGAGVVIDADARIGSGSRIGAGSYLGAGVEVGADCLIGVNVSILRDSTLGDRCVLHPGVRIGGDGFGFRWDGTAHRKIPQLGRVVIEDDVEIGCNSCVDRATLGTTRIGRGTKIDNLVQVAHNVGIGAHSILVSQSGVAGSSTLGQGVVVAGQVAISDHVTVGDGARIGGQAGVVKDIPAGVAVFGTPARPVKQALRESAALVRLPALLKQVERQQQAIDRLERRLADLGGGSSSRPLAPSSEDVVSPGTVSGTETD
ncbi:UDP-3-O-(3-hydroxymyristoyl)glucosamine N-acyltransferase [Thiocapsa marina]|uniref:UDP-3-O-acylglucosamine N-acyltransferase n=1 Tax=Thiocapsa marina 5811 TaxID=768671 RepID=F9UE01_9GAMM|nr:UDP-3-O-(3-hydroxymyristoyl)glucosamine N-acyltransferase [Thiocapsa marina]EGV17558.1 UDP-3-O-(3-hydroxymyristoyl) glucosamine N-acyltransferase [Thiocapsa marina 5811]